MTGLKASKHENEMLQDKVNALKTEYYKAESQAK
jgi:hypothetical protein